MKAIVLTLTKYYFCSILLHNRVIAMQIKLFLYKNRLYKQKNIQICENVN